MRVRAHFKNIDEVITTIWAATIKNRDRKKNFHDAGLPSSPDSVITRWATRLRAAFYYSENLPAVCTIVNNWTSAGIFSRVKDAINVEDLVPDLVKMDQYRTPAANVEFLEGSACTITEAYGRLKNMQFDDDQCSIKDYIKKRLSNSDLKTIINCTNLTIYPTSYALLLCSMLSKLLRIDRNFYVKNVKKYMMLWYNQKYFSYTVWFSLKYRRQTVSVKYSCNNNAFFALHTN